MAKKLTPYQAFKDNMKDAEALLSYARAFQNKRSRRMRKELRSRVGHALGIRGSQREALDCLESKDLFVVFMPEGSLGRDLFSDQQPLLRQSLVAACAALETYVADKAMEFVGPVLKADEPPSRMKDIILTVGQWASIEGKYTRRGWGIRDIVGDHLRKTSSTAPNQIGVVLSTIGLKKRWSQQVDRLRNAESGTTERELKEITERRNRIAHSADRKGRGRASSKAEEVEKQIAAIQEVVDALEELLEKHEV